MLCEKCHENQVSYIISLSLNSSTKEVRLCEECASYDMKHGIPEAHRGSDVVERECPRCHFKYWKSAPAAQAFSKSLSKKYISLLGCPNCYNEFREDLIPLLRRIHGSTIHKGKTRVAKSKKLRIGGNTLKSPQPPLQGGASHALKPMRYASFAEAEWMQGNGPDCDVVISTRVRLARNVSDHVFCGLAEESELQQIAATVENALVDINGCADSPLRNASIIKLKDLDPIELEFLIERHLISRDLAEKNATGEVIVGEKEVVSIMLNEEDHIRLQVINPGLQPTQSWEMINAIDNELARRIDYAFSPDWGYLTACPTNVGTGLRVSVMLHIPALAATREGNGILSSISDMGYAVRGMYGEGSQARGAFYQVSNETTLGQSEEEVIDRIRSIARQLVEREREERQLLIEKNGIKAEDKIFRSYGTLMNARLVSSREALELLSWVGLGANIGILPESRRDDAGRMSALPGKAVTGSRKSEDTDEKQEKLRRKIAQLLVLIRPAHLQKYEGRELDTAARDVVRAAVIRSLLKG